MPSGAKEQEDNIKNPLNSPLFYKECCFFPHLQGKILYKVRWKGYTSDDDTWEPEVHLEDCKEVLLEFRKKIVDKPKPVKKDIQVCLLFLCIPLKSSLFSRSHFLI